MKYLAHLATLLGLSTTLLVATPPAPRLSAPTAAVANAPARVAPAPAEAPNPLQRLPLPTLDSILLRWSRRRREDEHSPWVPRKRGRNKRHNRLKHRALSKGWI